MALLPAVTISITNLISHLGTSTAIMGAIEHVSPPVELDRIDNMQEEQNLDDSTTSFGADTLPDEDDSFLIMSDDAGQVYAPPAHLAARFYRDRARRKSSATSSRRNSLSSTQSHGSARSFRRNSSSQSNYIAQHLRRASIIESRKARLADRAAHAEQVRLRAALAKAAPRGSANASEERALAAQVAREKYLAKVTATCAEEVARAKQKALEMKARKMEDEKRQRQDMEDRLADAEKRRAEYQRNLYARRLRRASSQEKKLAIVVEDNDTTVEVEKPIIRNLDEETAVKRIQRTWMTRRRRAIVDAYIDLDLTLETVCKMSFEDLGEMVKDTRVMTATSKLLKFFRLQEEDNSQATTTRTFLSSYLIVAQPETVLSKRGAQEQDLIGKAREVIVLFESAVSRLAPWNRFCPSEPRLEDLSQKYDTYTAAFDAWRAQDSSALVETMVLSFVELDAIWQTVKEDSRGEVANDYREGIRDNQVILLSKIRKLAGPDRADYLIKRAIRESRRRRGRKRTAAEVRPRVAEATSIDSSGTAVAPFEAIPEPAIDTGAGARDFAKLFSPLPNNRILTHELAINKEFRISSSAQSDLRDAVNRQLCDSMRQGVDQGDGATWTTAMAECIRGKLLGILKPGNSMHSLVSEALDSDHIYKQCNAGVFSYNKFFDFMSSILPKLCAPFRDEEVKVLADELRSDGNDTGDMIEKLFRLLHFIDLLSLDYSNFLLMNAAPVLIRESAGYEQRMFAQDLESGTITLQNSKRWWRNASVNMLTEADRRDPEHIRLPADRPTAQKIYCRGLLDLAISQGVQDDADWPETLALDKNRLLEIRRNAMHVVCIGAALLTAKNLLKRDVRSQWKSQASRLWDLLNKDGLASEDIGQKAFGVLESAQNMPPATRTSLQSACTRFFAQAAVGRLTDPVLKVLFQRLKSHVFARVSAISSQDRVRAASTASEGLASAGLPEFVAQVSEMVDVLGRVTDVDWKSHGPWYDQIAREEREVQGAGEEA